jgi:drug/metabolite transporter (DMT)-like permease
MQTFGLSAAFVALAYAFAEGFGRAAHAQLLGDGLALTGAVLWGLTTVVIRSSKLASASAEKTLFYQLAVSAAVLFAFSVALNEPWPTQRLPILAIESLTFQTVIVAFVSYLIWFWLLRNYSATRISAFSFLTPLFGLIFSAALLQEAVGHRIILALIFVALGIYLVNRPQAAMR